MKDLITEIVKALVDQPQEVSVNEIGSSHTTVLEIRVAKPDMWKIIGKRGRTAQAIRTILSAAAGKTRKRYILEIVEWRNITSHISNPSSLIRDHCAEW